MPLHTLLPACIDPRFGSLYPDKLDNRLLNGYPYEQPKYLASLHSVATAQRNIQAASAQPGTNRNGGSAIVSSFSVDWYNRIHVTPNRVNVGNLVSTQVRDVILWNAYFEPKTLNTILESADAGTTLTQPYATPYALAALQTVTYSVQVSASGPPKVEGAYQFDFGFVSVPLTVTGDRIVVWPYAPQVEVTESLEWKTDIMRAKAGEQRIALRDYPRQSFSYSHLLTSDRDVAKARAVAVGWAHRQFGVPVWTELAYVGSLDESATTVAVDTTSADYRVGGTAFIWQDEQTYVTAGISQISEGSITLEGSVGTSMSGAYVMPMVYARAPQFSLQRGANQVIKVDVDFNVLYNKYVGGSIGLPTHKSMDVLSDTMYVVGAIEEKIEKVTTIIDNGFAIPYADAKYSNTDQTFTIAWSLRSKAELWRVRKWLHTLKGKQKSFWLPTNTHDLNLVTDANSTSQQAIDVQSINYALYYTKHAIRISRKNGVTTYHSVTGGTTDGAIDTLSFDAAIGTAVTIAECESISFMYKVRLDSDRVEINYSEGGQVTVKVPVREVLE